MDDPSLLLLIFLIFLSGIFSALEIAFFSLSEAKIEVLVKNKKKGARLVKKLKDHPEKLLTTILVGNNVVNILAASIATVMSVNYFGSNGVAIATFFMTLLILMFGEIIPKAIATTYAGKLASFFSFPLVVLQTVLFPIIKIFEITTKYILKMLRISSKHHAVSDEELRIMAKIGVKEGTIEKNEQLLIRNALRFNDIAVGQIMTPRVKMVSLDENTTIAESLDIIKKCQFSRIPIYNKNNDNITGIFYVKDVLKISEIDFRKKQLKELSNKPLFTATTQKIDNLFKEFQSSRIHIAIVLNEYGGTAGIITLEDIIEELVGEIIDETDKTTRLFRKVNNDTILAKAETEMKVVIDFFEIDDIDDEEFNQSINGYLISKLEEIPKSGTVYQNNSLKFIIEEATEKMIKAVRISRKVL